ncbi:MAG: hypothetical protein LBN74_04410, partial [Prevotella sp.]|nr:hypothetical protein [Prevotella sp.]
MNKGLLGFMIAALIGVIGFIIYYFFFRKKNVDVTVSPALAIPGMATNPIAPQDVYSNPVYVPASSSPTYDERGYGVIVGSAGAAAG